MKKQIAIASAILAATSYSFAEIALTESLSVEGFVDMSYSDNMPGQNDRAVIGVDQVEFDFLFNAGAVSAQVDVEYEEGTDGTNIEQAFVTYDLGNGAALTAGRFASQLGFEAFEPTGLYQYSTSISGQALPTYNQGIKYTNGNLGIALVDGVVTDEVSDGDGYSIEVAYSTDLGNGLNGFIGAVWNDQVDPSDDTYVVDAYVTYETGAWLFAAELVLEDDGDQTDTAGLLMANYSYSDVASITGRISLIDDINDENDDKTGSSASAYTLAHNYALADNLALVAEVSLFDVDGSEDNEVASAVELLFTF